MWNIHLCTNLDAYTYLEDASTVATLTWVWLWEVKHQVFELLSIITIHGHNGFEFKVMSHIYCPILTPISVYK